MKQKIHGDLEDVNQMMIAKETENATDISNAKERVVVNNLLCLLRYEFISLLNNKIHFPVFLK